jgi:ubiquinone/menaquinone biosynthesis C-methylase UbiE
MVEDISTKRWAENAVTWTRLTRAGYDEYRDVVNTPRFMQFLPDISGLTGLDIGCGEGTNTRTVAVEAGSMQAIDAIDTFITAAQEIEARNPLGITYQKADACHLPFDDASFDFATSFMCLMDFPGADLALAEAFRFLRPNGFLQFSILHPCFTTLGSQKFIDPATRRYGRTVVNYFDQTDGVEETWSFSALPKEIRYTIKPYIVPRYHRTLSQWVSDIVGAAFVLEAIQ